jgi:hypothetical protein
MLSRYAASGETVAHDCVLEGNPSHSGLDDIEREYPAELRKRLILYHYSSAPEALALRQRGYRVADRGEEVQLDGPDAAVVLDSAGEGA